MPEIEVDEKIDAATENNEQATDTVVTDDKNLNVIEKPKRGRRKKVDAEKSDDVPKKAVSSKKRTRKKKVDD